MESEGKSWSKGPGIGKVSRIMTTTKPAPLTKEQLDGIEIPDFERKYVKEQPKFKNDAVKDKNGNVIKGREFTASGAKADFVVKYLMHGGFTRQEIATFVGCSVSRVGEVIWAMNAAGVEYPEPVRRRDSYVPPNVQAEEDAKSEDEDTESEDESDENTEDESEDDESEEDESEKADEAVESNA